jgi:alginate O-acetyltransferase complex protein AlgJ
VSESPGSELPPVHESWLPRDHSLYRPRHSRRQRSALVSAAVFFCLPLVLLGLGMRAPQIENKPLAGFPSPLDGWGFFTGFSQWAIDHLPLRDVAVTVDGAVSRGIFGEPPRLGGGSGEVVGPPTGPVAPPSLSDEERKRIQAQGYPKVIEGKDDWLYLGYDVLGACLPERPVLDVIANLQRLRDAVVASGRQFVLVIGPDKTTMVPQFLPDEYLGEDCAGQATEEFWHRAVNDAGAIDLRPALREAGARRGVPVYSRLDTHWTYEGGLVMVRSLAETIEPGVTASWKATPEAVIDREADIPPLIGEKGVFPLQTYALAPDGRTVRSRAVDSAFREPLRLTQPDGKGIVGPRVGMVADSLTLFATPFLAGGFSDVTVVHSDTAGADPAAVGRMLAEADVVVVEAVERSLVGGINPMVTPEVVAAVAAELARSPR